MNIILLTSAINENGGARQALQLARGLTNRGHKVRFFTRPRSALRRFDPDLNWRDLLGRPMNWKRLLEKEMPDDQPCVVQAFHNRAVKTLSLFGLLWRLQRKPAACLAYRGVIYKPNNPLPYLLPGIRRFVVNSASCGEKLPLLWRKKLVEVVYNSVIPDDFAPTLPEGHLARNLGLPSDAPVIGAVLNNSRAKGLDVLIKAFAKVKDQTAHLLVVGADAFFWKGHCADLGIAERVHFSGQVDNVGDYLRLFDLMVMPSRFESLPNTLLEGMCLGLPAVCTMVGAMPELIRTKEFLVPKENTDELAKAIDLALDNPEMLRQAGQANLDKSSEFSLDRRLDRMESIYKDLLQKISK